MNCRWMEGVQHWEEEACGQDRSCVLQRATQLVFPTGSNVPSGTGVSHLEAVCVLGKSPACASAMERDLRDQNPAADMYPDVLEWTAACEGTDLLNCAGEWVTDRFECQSCDLTYEDACR
jgi:hypothetical protein